MTDMAATSKAALRAMNMADNYVVYLRDSDDQWVGFVIAQEWEPPIDNPMAVTDHEQALEYRLKQFSFARPLAATDAWVSGPDSDGKGMVLKHFTVRPTHFSIEEHV